MKHFILILIILSSSFLSTTQAIPAFARKYAMSCQTCHSPFPVLKPYGEEFAGNGFALPDKDAPRYFVETGDDRLSLLRDLPFAIRLDGALNYNKADQNKFDLEAPWILKLLSGGEIAKDISYYFYFFFSERGEVAGVEDAFIMFNDLFGIDLDLAVGQFQVSDPLFKRELRVTLEDYEVYKPKVGLSNINLTYDRGFMLSLGLETGTDIVLAVVNGNGIGGANSMRLYDNDGKKAGLLRLSQEITDFLRIGAFGYYGTEDQSNAFAGTVENKPLMYGPDLTLTVNDQIAVNAQFIIRKDDNFLLTPFSVAPSKDYTTKGAMAEVLWTPQGDKSTHYTAFVFNWIESDQKNLDTKSFGLHTGYMLRRNIRLFGELQYDLIREYPQFSFGFSSAF